MFDDGQKTISLELSAEAAESLRQRKVIQYPVIGEDDWNDEIPLPAALSTCKENSSLDQPITERSDEEDLSVSPPPHLPLIQINLKRLLGFQPINLEEAEELTAPVKSTLWGDPKEGYRGIDERLAQLFESGVALHVTSDDKQSGSQYSTIAYPPYLPDVNSEGELELLLTERVWKQLIQPHGVDVVNQLLVLLKDCPRSLTWKYAMHKEIRAMAMAEENRRRRQQRDWELYIWRQSRRKNQLEQLYNVRERLEERLEKTRSQVDQLTQEREARIRLAMGEADPDVEGLAEGLGDMFGKDYESDEDGNGSLLSNYSDPDDESLSVDKSVAGSTSGSTGVLSVHSQTKTDLSTDETMDKKENTPTPADSKELALREELTSPHLRLLLTLNDSLDKKMTQVHDLLESLQEEEWHDEEEGVTEPEVRNAKVSKRHDASLLDQILAMILGSFVSKPGLTSTELLTWQKDEHRSIVDGWYDHFGRLPEPLLEKSTAPSTDFLDTEENEGQTSALTETDKEALRASLGLASDEPAADWDDDDNESAEQKRPTGLRPGGRV